MCCHMRVHRNPFLPNVHGFTASMYALAQFSARQAGVLLAVLVSHVKLLALVCWICAACVRGVVVMLRM